MAANTARICAKKAYFRLPLGDAPPRLTVGLRPAGVLPLGDAPARVPLGLRPAGVLPLGDAPPRLTVGLRPAGVLPLGDAPPRLPLGLRPAGVLPLGDAPARLPLGLRPAGVLPLGDAPPRLTVGLRPAGVLPLGDAPPRLPLGASACWRSSSRRRSSSANRRASACWSSSSRRRSSLPSLSDRSLLSVSSVGCSSSSMTLSSALERRPGGASPIMRSMGSESAVTSSLASFKTASWTRQVTAASSASWSITSRTRCQCRRCSRSFPIAAMYSHASPIVRSVPPSFVGSGEVSFLERYSGRNMR